MSMKRKVTGWQSISLIPYVKQISGQHGKMLSMNAVVPCCFPVFDRASVMPGNLAVERFPP